jgi:hypothetical protein
MNKTFSNTLKKYEKKVFSQTVEDGILEGIFDNIGITNKFFVEFGAWDGVHLSNTANLRINKNWKGLLMEGNKERADQYDYINHEFINAENINYLFEKNNVPSEFDLLSIDIDGNDYWVWKALDEKKFSPRVVVVEYNCNHQDQSKSIAIEYSPELNSIEPSIYYYGATIPAYYKLGKLKGYSLVYRVNLHNLFFVRNDLLSKEDQNIPLELFLNKNQIAENHIGYGIESETSRLHGDNMTWHWNEYADTNITIYWPQDFNREWVEV